ncbi:hypothetical protein Nepgr_021577 [Nepenthes gracilis]|uniref:Uncharacterized protein n=1 Tax=Nepenthes gracilis TaxID=150966 RepID=A0AAD3SZA7_NEPGR|nr:hypothetical protein Nepgr_021577 [Nepenthes gracilis]
MLLKVSFGSSKFVGQRAFMNLGRTQSPLWQKGKQRSPILITALHFHVVKLAKAAKILLELFSDFKDLKLVRRLYDKKAL